MHGDCQAVESRYITLIKLIVFLEEEFFGLVHSEIKLLFFVEYSIHPVAMLHIHWLNVVRLDDTLVYLVSFTDDLVLLTSVLGNQDVSGWVNDICLHS